MKWAEHFNGASGSAVAPWQGISNTDQFKLPDNMNVSPRRRLKSRQYALPARPGVGSAEALAVMASMLTMPVLPAAEAEPKRISDAQISLICCTASEEKDCMGCATLGRNTPE